MPRRLCEGAHGAGRMCGQAGACRQSLQGRAALSKAPLSSDTGQALLGRASLGKVPPG